MQRVSDERLARMAANNDGWDAPNLVRDLRDLRAEHAALVEDHARLKAALSNLEREDLEERAADDGDEFVECSRCGAQEWGTIDVYDIGDAAHRAREDK